MRFSDASIDHAISRRLRTPELLSSDQYRMPSLSELNRRESSAVDRESHKVTEVQQTEDMRMHVRQSVDQSCGESTNVQPKMKSTLSPHQIQVNKNVQPQQGDQGRALSNKTRSTSSSTVSSQSRFRLEQQRLQEELDLQTNLDEERIALRLETLALKESREKKILGRQIQSDG